VITSVFVGGPSDGHGNHQTAGAMAQEAFKVAGDPNVFPDQIKAGLRPWTPLKVYARAPLGRRGGESLAVNVEVPEGTYDPMLGASYVQISREGLGHQKSQNGGGAIPKAGQVLSAYHRFGSVIPAAEKEESFFDGIDTSLLGIATLAKGDTGFIVEGLRKINSAVEQAISEFSGAHPERVAPALATGLKETIALLDAVEKSGLSDDSKYGIHKELEIKRVQFNNALAESLGLSLTATVAPAVEPNPRFAMFMGDPATMQIAIPGQTFGVKVHVVSQSSAAVTLRSAVVESSGQKEKWPVVPVAGSSETELVNGKPLELKFTVAFIVEFGALRPATQFPSKIQIGHPFAL
jgi:hypothetical protein